MTSKGTAYPLLHSSKFSNSSRDVFAQLPLDPLQGLQHPHSRSGSCCGLNRPRLEVRKARRERQCKDG